jgi:hypothetical protein
MAKDIIIIPESGTIDFYSSGNFPISSIVISGNNIVVSSPSGQIIIEDIKVSGSLDASSLPSTSTATNNDYILVEQSGLVNRSLISNTQYKFPSDLTVSLSNNRTFGRYINGSVIPASGKTPAEVINLAIVEPINPTVSLTSSTTIAFNQTNINNVLNFSYTINSLNATVSSSSLEWRRGGVGSWTVLSTSTTTPSSYTHSLTDTNFNTSAFNYRYIVTDSVGAATTGTLNITPAAYVAPGISISLTAPNATSPETSTLREKGNVSTTLSGTITRNSVNVSLTNYTIQYSVDSGAWTNVGTAVSIGPGTSSITSTNHNPVADNTASNIRYRVVVVDAYTTTTSSISTINFYYMIYYGPSASAPTNSTSVRALPSRGFINGSSPLSNPFNLNTGTDHSIFTVALPNSSTITQVLDLDALNANITANYINSVITVNDYGGNSSNYNVYTLTNAVPYSSSHRHQISRS